MFKKYILMILVTSTFASFAQAAPGWTEAFTITSIDFVDARGMMILGNFPKTDCTSDGGMLFIDASFTQYKNAVAVATAALALNQKLKAYFNDCRPVGFYSVATTTYPTLVGTGGMLRVSP